MKTTSIRESQADFFDRVYQVVRLIPFGRATSYGAIAKYLGAARSSRMVGYAINSAHLDATIPAHRVVNRLGILSGKHHFPADKPMEELLKSEGVSVKNDQIENWSAVFWNPETELRID
jgi:methylated-DNA-protein-cysteine methyltransferase-like protein